METSELYKLFQQHPVVTTDSRDCPEGSIFFALKAHRLMATSLRKQPSTKGVPMLWLTRPNMPPTAVAY